MTRGEKKMRGFGAFYKKEILELVRSYRGFLVGGLAVMFGILSPLLAKLTPWLMRQYSESFKEQGIIVGEVTVTAKDSWLQFDKNYPILLIVVLVLFSGSFVGEYAKGTLIPLVTKGLGRRAVVVSKLSLQLLVWTVCLVGSFGITWGYTAYFWDNSRVKHLPFVLLCYWLAGVFFVTLMAFFSAFAGASVRVLLGTGMVYFLLTLLGLLKPLENALPLSLLGCSSMLTQKALPEDYLTALIVTGILSLGFTVLAVVITGKRKL